jgi:hypothetical protein
LSSSPLLLANKHVYEWFCFYSCGQVFPYTLSYCWLCAISRIVHEFLAMPPLLFFRCIGGVFIAVFLGTVFATINTEGNSEREVSPFSVLFFKERQALSICNHKCRERDGIPFYSFHPCILYLVSVVVNWDRSAAPNLLLFKSRH